MRDTTHDSQPEETQTRRWPTFPSPPSSGTLLLGAGCLTTAAIYVALMLREPDLRQSPRWIVLTILFLLFILSIYFLPESFARFWKRAGMVLFQILLIFTILIIGRGNSYLPILYFITIPSIFLSVRLRPAFAFTLLCLTTFFLAYVALFDLQTTLFYMLPYGGGFAFFAAISMALIEQQKAKQQAETLLTELEDAHRQLQAYAGQVEALAVAEERNRLARDIHDSLGHYMTAMTMQLEAAGKLVANEPERAASSIAKAKEMARQSLAEVRRSVAALRASPLDTMTLEEAIRDVVDSLRNDGIAVTYTITGNVTTLPIQAKMTLYRAAQEGLTNVRKHASASAVEVTLDYRAEEVTLSMLDNGLGRHDEGDTGFGLLGLQERVALLGGSMEARNRPTGGFRLHIAVPAADRRQDDG